MTRLLTEGFEMGDALWFTAQGACDSNTINGMSGNYVGRVSITTYKSLPVTLSEGYFRIRVACQQNQKTYDAVAFYSDNQLMAKVVLDGGGTGFVQAYVNTTKVATGTVPLPSSMTTVLIEVYYKVADSGGKIQVKVDGILDIDYTGDTKPSSQTTFNKLQWAVAVGGGWVYMDDLALNSTDGATDNSWCGDGRIVAYFPDGNGDVSQMTGSDGNSTDNYALVDEKPSNSDTDYVESSTVDEYDLYHIAGADLTNQTILRVWVESRSKDTVAAGGKLALGVKPSGGSEAWSSDLNLLTAYDRIKSDEWTTNPSSSSAWTDSDIDGLQIGVKAR